MNGKRTSSKVPSVVGWLCIAAGIYPLAIAVGLVPADSSAVHAPMWVVFLSGLVFIVGGAMMLVGMESRANDLLACLLLLTIGSIGAWVAIRGPADGFSGGIPFLPRSTNTSIARWLFGLGAAVCLLLSAYAARSVFSPRS
ncbi:MAG: hypothetical protein WBO47_11095 [Gammaproteobacteria bacterium]